MFAFANKGDRSKVRQVEIPDEETKMVNLQRHLLQLVFTYGQNDIQPRPFYSVSVGDVIEIDSEYEMIMGSGFKKLSKDEFDALVPPTSMYAYQLGRK